MFMEKFTMCYYDITRLFFFIPHFGYLVIDNLNFTIIAMVNTVGNVIERWCIVNPGCTKDIAIQNYFQL